MTRKEYMLEYYRNNKARLIVQKALWYQKNKAERNKKTKLTLTQTKLV